MKKTPIYYFLRALSLIFCSMLLILLNYLTGESYAQTAIFNVKNYGATGVKKENCRFAIQKAIDDCAESGGGMVYFPPGEYTSGTIILRSHIHFHLEAGATLFAARDKSEFEKRALIYGENIENITIEGRGIIDGQAEFEWDDMRGIDPNFRDTTEALKAMGKRLLRTYPIPPSQRTVLLVNCKDIQIKDLSFIRASSWTITPWGCERLVIDGIYVSTSLTEGVWADGIDPDCCKDVRISNCTIETGDDCISLKASNFHGEPRPCENITITNCRLTTASTAFKIGDEIYSDIKHVTMNNCVIRNANRGLGIMIRGRGNVSDVTFSNLTMECTRHDWFWWGDGDPFLFVVEKSIYPRLPDKYKTPLGTMKNILITNVLIHAMGSSKFYGHSSSPLEGITLDNVKIFMSTDPTKIQKAVYGISFQMAKDIKLRNVEVLWDKPESKKWESALYLEDIKNFDLDGFVGRQAHKDESLPAVVLKQVKEAMIHGCRALPGTAEFLHFYGEKTGDIHLFENNFVHAKAPYVLNKEVSVDAINTSNNFLPR